MKKTPHKHAALIREWALNTNRKVQWYHEDGDKWVDCAAGYCPDWTSNFEYRFKPEAKKDITTSCKITKCYGAIMWNSTTDHVPYANLKLTFDGDTGMLKQAEVIE